MDFERSYEKKSQKQEFLFKIFISNFTLRSSQKYLKDLILERKKGGNINSLTKEYLYFFCLFNYLNARKKCILLIDFFSHGIQKISSGFFFLIQGKINECHFIF